MKDSLLPLVVDLDGTLIRTDLLVESFLGLIKKNPLYVFLVAIWILKGKRTLKAEIAKRVNLDVKVLPYNQALLDYLKEQKAQGRTLALATASHLKYADQVAKYLGLFDRVFATSEGKNIAAGNKAEVLCEAYGEKQFVYAGNAEPDLKVWKRSARSIVVGHSNHLHKQAESLAPVERRFQSAKPSLKVYLKACRLHQWVKNVLMFVPLVTAHKIFEVDLLISDILAFLAFSLCASSVYLLNDLLDLDADRQHKSKCKRPFASGTLPALHGILLIPVLLLVVLGLVVALPLNFAMVLVIYFIATTAYSFALKKRIMLDVIILAGLYTIRLVAGAAATGIALSQWLLAFSMFIFLSLALVKRYTELMDLRSRGVISEAKGRGYEVADIELLSSLGGASGYLSVLVLALYINSDSVQAMYHNSQILWAVCPLMLYWISRVWVIAHRGRMHDDPIIFAIKDSVSRYTVILIGAIFIGAIL